MFKTLFRIFDSPYFSAAIQITFLAIGITVALSGCKAIQVGGASEVNTIIFVEPGEVCEIAQDEKIEIAVKTPDGKQRTEKKNLAGFVAMPKSVYRQLREDYIKLHPETPK